MTRITAFANWLLLTAGLLLAPLQAETIPVSTTLDSLTIDGLCSLREAVEAANTNLVVDACPAGEAAPVVDVIELPPGDYSLTIEAPPVGQNNLINDLNLVESVTLRGLGSDFIWWDDPVTPAVETLDVFNDPNGFPRDFETADLPEVIISNGFSTPGDDEIRRLLSIHEDGDYAFENLGLVGADCRQQAAGGGAALDAALVGSVSLFRVAVFDTTVDEGCSAIETSVASVAIEESVLANTLGFCTREDCNTGAVVKTESSEDDAATAVVRSTLVTGNTAFCATHGCEANRLIAFEAKDQTFEQTVVSDNHVECRAPDCNARPVVRWNAPGSSEQGPGPVLFTLTLEDLEFSSNSVQCSDVSSPGDRRGEGPGCTADDLVHASGRHTPRTYRRVRFRNNLQHCDGFSCAVREVVDDLNEVFAINIDTMELVDNVQSCEGDQCEVDNVVRFDALAEEIQGYSLTINHLTVSGNTIRCAGEDCDTEAAAVFGGTTALDDVVVTDNINTCEGNYCSSNNSLTIEGDRGHTIDGLTATGNETSCLGTPCSTIACDSTGSCVDQDGGAVSFGGHRAQFDGPPASHLAYHLLNATIENNTSSGSGAGLINGTRLTIEDSSISGNTSTLAGGGIRNNRLTSEDGTQAESGFLVLVNTTVSGNQTIADGAGVYNPPNSTLRLDSSTITTNTAGGDGGGVFNEGLVQALFTSTIVNNLPAATDCVDSGAGTGCGDIGLFFDDFESGDTSAWQ